MFALSVPSFSKELKRVCDMFAYYAKLIPNFSKKTRPLLQVSNFSIGPETDCAFIELKNGLGRASLGAIQEGVPFETGADALNNPHAGALCQGARPVVHASHP